LLRPPHMGEKKKKKKKKKEKLQKKGRVENGVIYT
jgi:hypothetical protein